MTEAPQLPVYMTVDIAMQQFSLGRTKVNDLIRDGRIVSNKVTGRRLIETKSLLRLLNDEKETV